MNIKKLLFTTFLAIICFSFTNTYAESVTYTIFDGPRSVKADGTRLYFTIPFDYTPSTLTIKIKAIGSEYSETTNAIQLYDIKTDTRLFSFSGSREESRIHTVDISGKGNTFYFANNPYPKEMVISFEYCLAQCDVSVGSNNSLPVFKVLSGIPFTEALYSTISGNNGGVTATAMDGYTELSGTLTISNGNSQQIRKMVIGGKTLLFKVIAPPTLDSTATVTFI